MSGAGAVGGYFGLELGAQTCSEVSHGFHTVRAALKALLRVLVPEGCSKVLWFPSFMCPAVEEVFVEFKGRIVVRKYGLLPNLSPCPFGASGDDLVFVYNVFGLTAVGARKGLIVDNSHAFFAKPVDGHHTFYNFRKFVGVPDGAILRTTLGIDSGSPLQLDGDFSFLFRRHDQGAEAGFESFKRWEESIFTGEVMGMSSFSKAVISRVDFKRIRLSRLRNFGYVHRKLAQYNGLAGQIERALKRADFVPFSYPFMIDAAGGLRELLAHNRVYTPTLWSGLELKCTLSEFERELAYNTVHIPIDQRNDLSDMRRVVAMVLGFSGLR